MNVKVYYYEITRGPHHGERVTSFENNLGLRPQTPFCVQAGNREYILRAGDLLLLDIETVEIEEDKEDERS